MTDETSATNLNPASGTTDSGDASKVSSPNNKLDAIIYSAGTDVGMRREENQDSYGIMLGEGYRLFIVADGMGGVKGGSIASNLAIAVVERRLRDRAFLTADDVVEALKISNEEVFKRGNTDSSLNGMGTTFVALFVTPQGVYTIHVGDSRAYQISGGGIHQLTEDHTLVQELVRSGAITPEQAEHHPVAHMLTRSIGPADAVDIDCNLIQRPVRQNDRFLLCSDGLYNLVTEPEIAEICSEFSTDDAVQSLIDLANERGGTDNITIIIADTAQFSVATPTAPLPSEPRQSHSRISKEDMMATAEAAVAAQAASTAAAKPSPISAIYPTSPSASTSPLANRLGISGYHETSDVKESPESVEQTTEPTAPSTTATETASPEASPDLVYQDPTTEEVEANTESEGEFVDDEFANDPIEQSTILPASALQASNRFYLLVGAGFMGGLVASYLFFSASASSHRHTDELVEVIPTMTVEENVAPIKSAVPNVEELLITAPQEQAPTVKEIPNNSRSSVVAPPTTRELLANETIKFGPAERSSILKRKRDLELSLKDIDIRLAMLRADRPTDAETLQKTSAHRAEELSAKIDQLRTDIEVAIRQLATWYDRKRRLESSDRVSMASELAPTVTSVKTKKEEFEKITWDYLKEVEALRYGAADASREQKLAELAKKRADKMKELSEEVRSTIEKALSTADDSVAELTLQRSSLEKELENTRQELEFARTASSADSIKKAGIIETLKARREASSTELGELEKLLPGGE